MATANATKTSIGFPWWAILVQGIFSIIIGILLLTNPGATTVVIVQFIGIYWLVAGIFSLVGMFMDSTMWGWKLFSGIIGILAGIVILQHPLVSAIMLPGILVVFMGVGGLIMGTIGVIAAFQGAGWGAGALGILSIIFGILLLSSPYITGLALPWVFGFFAVVGGIIAIFAAFKQRRVEA
jgi:uncharacterized membrane protein HdeD (DUF308 family)